MSVVREHEHRCLPHMSTKKASLKKIMYGFHYCGCMSVYAEYELVLRLNQSKSQH